jgi:hypothetical protein
MREVNGEPERIRFVVQIALSVTTPPKAWTKQTKRRWTPFSAYTRAREPSFITLGSA